MFSLQMECPQSIDVVCVDNKLMQVFYEVKACNSSTRKMGPMSGAFVCQQTPHVRTVVFEDANGTLSCQFDIRVASPSTTTTATTRTTAITTTKETMMTNTARTARTTTTSSSSSSLSQGYNGTTVTSTVTTLVSLSGGGNVSVLIGALIGGGVALCLLIVALVVGLRRRIAGAREDDKETANDTKLTTNVGKTQELTIYDSVRLPLDGQQMYGETTLASNLAAAFADAK